MAQNHSSVENGDVSRNRSQSRPASVGGLPKSTEPSDLRDFLNKKIITCQKSEVETTDQQSIRDLERQYANFEDRLFPAGILPVSFATLGPNDDMCIHTYPKDVNGEVSLKTAHDHLWEQLVGHREGPWSIWFVQFVVALVYR